ncbi:tyrosine-type recombinase/integrase [Paenibacillus chartarius]|uniref:Tyrosine-type recombinase/integrase n=1 Tax=Paenibacillus chartarius TaxID=747481 RepID=A0ABV6DRZ1_9BACL
MKTELQSETAYLIEQFKQHLLLQGKEESTVKLYSTELSHFLNWLDRMNKTLSSIEEEDIFASRDELYLSGKRLSTINKYVSILATFFRWAERQGMVKGNPAASARYHSPKSTELPRWLTEDEEARLLEIAAKERNPFKRARNEALIHVLLYAGLRVEEVPHLRLSSVGMGELKVFDDAGKLLRIVPVAPQTYSKLAVWLEERSTADKETYNNSSYLFVTERSGAMQARAVQFVIQAYASKLGSDFSCHDLRNTYCRRLAEIRTPILHLKQWAGHKSFLTTYQYYAGLQ